MNQLSDYLLLAAYRGDRCESKAAGDDQMRGRMTLALLVMLLVGGNAIAQRPRLLIKASSQTAARRQTGNTTFNLSSLTQRQSAAAHSKDRRSQFRMSR
jgi:hypothetical protein